MAAIHLDSMEIVGSGGPAVPGKLAVRLVDIDLGGRTVKGLALNIGRDTVHIWPADPERMRELGDKLLAIADELEPVSPSVEARPGR